jgi:hypothetical protein
MPGEMPVTEAYQGLALGMMARCSLSRSRNMTLSQSPPEQLSSFGLPVPEFTSATGGSRRAALHYRSTPFRTVPNRRNNAVRATIPMFAKHSMNETNDALWLALEALA